jgi:hypothetical protein
MVDIRQAIPGLLAAEVAPEARAVIRRLRSNMEEALRAFTEDEDDQDSDRGRLNMPRLIQAILGGERHPFLEDGRPGVGLSTEIVLMFDNSSSMRKLGEPFLRSLLYATGSVLASYAPDVQLNLAFFSDVLTVVHTCDKHWTPELGSKVANAYSAKGGTQWAQCALPLIPMLAKSRKQRKILLTVCDGDINWGHYPEVMKELKVNKIEATFLTIGEDVPEGLVGDRCEKTPLSFAEALAKALLAAISPEFV